MKKLFTLFVAAFAALSVNAQTEETLAFVVDAYPWNYTVSANSNVTITGSSQWGEYKLTDQSSITADDYKTLIVYYSNGSGGDEDSGDFFGVKIDGDLTKDGDAVSGGLYLNLYQDEPYGEYDLSTVTGTITTLNIQAKLAGAKVTVDKAVLIKNDDTEEQLTFGGSSWGITVSPMTTPNISYTGQYGGLEMVLESDGSSITYDPTTDADYNKVIIVELEEAITDTLMIEFDAASGGVAWFNFPAGETVLTATLTAGDLDQDQGTLSAAIAKVYLKAASTDNYPIAAKIKTARITTSEATGISAVKVEDAAADNAPVYNLQGQKVSKDTKGILIQNGKKFVNK